MQDFEAINKAARWDYQRDRIYIRTDDALKKAKRKKTELAKRAVHIGKLVVCEPLPACPRCQRKGPQTFREITKRLQDLRFGKSGVMDRGVSLSSLLVSSVPGVHALAAGILGTNRRWSEFSPAFCIFEIIELCVSQRSVTETLNRLFGFQMDEIVVRRCKERGAEYYLETRKKIFAAMVEAA